MKTGFIGTLTIVLITLKLLELIELSWIWVLAPLWIPIALTAAIFVIVVIISLLILLSDLISDLR